MSDDWDRIISDLHDVHDMDRALTAMKALDLATDETWLPRLHQLLAEGRDFWVREAAAYPIARLEGLKALPQLLHALQLGVRDGHDNDGLVTLIVGLVQADSGASGPYVIGDDPRSFGVASLRRCLVVGIRQ